MNHAQLQKKGLSFLLALTVLVVGATLNIKNTTAVSPIDNLQPGEWYEVPNSKIRAVLPSPIPPGNGPANIIKAWNGGLYDTRRDNFIVWGGGHGDYAGNEIYSFNIGTLQWSRSWGPSAIASMTPAGSSTCPDTYQDGMPAARHTYGGLEYLPNVDKFFSMGGSLWQCGNPTNSVWTFDFASQGWIKKGPITPIAGRWGGLELGVNTAYDPNTGHLFATSNTTELLEYDPLTDIWKIRGNIKAKYSMTSAVDSKRKYMVSIGNTSPYSVIDTPGTIYRYNLATTGTITQEKIVSTGATEILSVTAPAFQYDPVSDQYVAWKGGSDIYTLNPDTFVWTRRPAAATNTVTPTQPTEWGTFGRFRYIPSKNAFILVNSIDENVYIYKLSQGAGSTVSSTSVPPVADIIAPTVSVTSPGAGASVSGTVTVSANATDAGGMAGVQFKIDGAVLGAEDTASPYSASLNTALFSNGAHSLTATARDSAGNQTTSTAVSIIISNAIVSGNTGSTVVSAPATTTVTQINIPSGVFVALDRPDRGKGVAGGTKHTNWAFNPIDGRLYQTGGDFGGLIGYSSYRQESFSLSLAERFANKADRNAGWRLEYPYCGPDGGVQPKSPDFVGWTWDSKRKLFWFVPGLLMSTASNCLGETADNADNLKYLRDHLMTFNPFESNFVKRWTDMGKNVGPNYYGTWQSDYDPQTDTLIRLGIDSNTTAVADVYNIQANTWTEYKLGDNALGKPIRIWAEGHATDMPGRAIYTIDGQAGRLFRYNVDAHTITDLGPIPGGRLNVWGSNDTYLAWDSINKIVFYFRFDNSTLYVYHPDTKTWETMPNVTQPAGLTPHTRHGMVFDPYQNVLALLGYGNDDIPDTNMYLYRYAPGGSTQYTVTNTPPASTSTSSSGTGTGTTSTTGGTTAGSTTTVADTTPPDVVIISPYSNAAVSGMITVTANAADAGGVAGVQFMVDGSPLGSEDVASPYSQSFDTTTRSNGMHVLTAVARDKAGNKKVSTVVIINISNVSVGTTVGTVSGTKEQGTAGSTSSTGATGSSSVGTSSGSTQQTSGTAAQSTSSSAETGRQESAPSVQPQTPPTSGGATSPINQLTYGYSGGAGGAVSTTPANTIARTEGGKHFEKSLYPGLADQEVVRLQKVLIIKGYLPVGSDSGYFGALTQEAVKKFQCEQGVVCGGVPGSTGYGLVGSATRIKLNEVVERDGLVGTVPGTAPAASSQASAPQNSQTTTQKAFTKPLFLGRRDNEVKALQNLLVRLGYLQVSPTGYFGPATREAVKKFQCAQGIVCSGDPRDTGYGLVGGTTRNKLNELQK